MGKQVKKKKSKKVVEKDPKVLVKQYMAVNKEVDKLLKMVSAIDRKMSKKQDREIEGLDVLLKLGLLESLEVAEVKREKVINLLKPFGYKFDEKVV